MNLIRQFTLTLLLVELALSAWVPVRAETSATPPEQLEFFEKSVRPLLAEHCYSCHAADSKKLQAGLRVDSRTALLQGGDSGEAIVPGDADASLLIEAVRYESYEMPPKGKLPADEIAILERWVSLGAPWPDEDTPATETSAPEFHLQERVAEHWVWQPISSPQIPQVQDAAWPVDALDHFILKRLEQADLHPAGDAAKSALLRRLYFDLIGLPPTPTQTAQFLDDPSPDALPQLVDQLLQSPHFGERWGRHWLDLVRYAESRGHEFDNDSPNAFQYRDYVIRAFNADLPYDQFVQEHIAGDLLSQPRLNPESGFNESILGTGFWFLGEWVHSPVDIRKDESDRFDNMIDVMSKTFLGLTVSCARCHDHKFDAISTADYYSLSGYLEGSVYRQVRFESMEHNRRVAAELAAVDAKFRSTVQDLLADHDLSLKTVQALDDEAKSTIVVDYSEIEPNEYYQDGYLFGDRPRHVAQPYLETTDNEPSIAFSPDAVAASDSFWNGLESLTEKGVNNRSRLANLPRSGRMLRTPTFTCTDRNIACRVSGKGYVVACVDSHRLIAGPLHGETIKEIGPNAKWVKLNLSRYIGHQIHLEFSPDKDAQLELSMVTQGASKEIQKRIDRQAAETAEAVAALAVTARQTLAIQLNEQAKAWAAERQALRSKIMHPSRLAMAMMDGTGEDARVLIRGNSSKPGDIEPRHFLTAVAGNEPMKIQSGSGRLELAESINDPSNPLTSRVIVNRIWHHLIGRGIVPTTDDFGVLGRRPTHPELLDHLAKRFTDDGQSIKRLIRAIVLSRTYQMSSQTDANAVAADPKNLLWHHLPPKRLDGESIRDALLALSGQLDVTQFGESVPIHLTSFMDGRGRPGQSGPLDGGRRRSIYVAVRRNFISPFMLTFDTPVPFSTMGRRNVSNVPAQALILMNDPLVIDMANKWAARSIKKNSAPELRIRWLYTTAFARQPTEKELSVATEFVNSQANERSVAMDDVGLWSDFAHALINTKEFIFLR